MLACSHSQHEAMPDQIWVWAARSGRRGVWKEWGHEEERKQKMGKELEYFKVCL